MKLKKQIVAMGGGGFSMEPRNQRLDRYILSLARKRRPRVCFLATASGDSKDYLAMFHRAMKRLDCISDQLLLFQRTVSDPAKFLLAQDVIYVGGGNTANMLAIWRLHGVDRALRAAWNAGVILCGLSAGMNCWFDCCTTDSFGGLRDLNDGLGFLPGSACPHYHGEPRRRPLYHNLVRNGFPAGIAADDCAAVHFVGRKILRCVCSRPDVCAYQVRRLSGKIVESPLPMQLLNRLGQPDRVPKF